MITPASKFWKGPAPMPEPYDFHQRRGYVGTRVRNHGPRLCTSSDREKARRRQQIERGSLKAANGAVVAEITAP